MRSAKLRHELGDAARAVELLERVEREAKQTDAADDARQLIEQWRGK